jgi:hypothetical protein
MVTLFVRNGVLEGLDMTPLDQPPNNLDLTKFEDMDGVMIFEQEAGN